MIVLYCLYYHAHHATLVSPLCHPFRDMIGIAATGSGKTLGFGLPMMAHIKAQLEAGVVGKGKGPFAVTVAPTRELAIQICTVSGKGDLKCEM